MAIAALAEANVRVTRVSSFYETEPVDLREQPWFLNCVVQGDTEARAVDLLRALRGIESHMGSKKLVSKGPRLIDLDLLLYGDDTVDTRAGTRVDTEIRARPVRLDDRPDRTVDVTRADFEDTLTFKFGVGD